MDIDQPIPSPSADNNDPGMNNDSGQWIAGVIGCVCQLLNRLGLRDQPDIVREIAETFGEICRSSAVSGSPSVCPHLHRTLCLACSKR